MSYVQMQKSAGQEGCHAGPAITLVSVQTLMRPDSSSS